MTSRKRLVAVACALLVIVLWASTSAPARVWRAATDESPTTLPEFEMPVFTSEPSAEPEEYRDGATDDGGTAWAIMQTLLLGLLVVALAWAVWTLRVVIWKLVRRPETIEQRTFSVLPDIESAITDDAPAQMAALATGSPRNAIVACWVRLEDAVASIGIERHAAETAAELTSRVLKRHAGGRDAIAELARLYREARFSTHELGEAERVRAIDALQRLHADLGLVPVGTDHRGDL